MTTTYTIRFSHWRRNDRTFDTVQGYNAWDFLPLPPEDGFANRDDATRFIVENYAGPDIDGVDAVFDVERLWSVGPDGKAGARLYLSVEQAPNLEPHDLQAKARAMLLAQLRR